MKIKIKGGAMNIRPIEEAIIPYNKLNPAEMTPYNLPHNQDKNSLKPEAQPITPTSTTNLFSTKLRKLNNYPEWNTDAGIENVINTFLHKKYKLKNFKKNIKTFL